MESTMGKVYKAPEYNDSKNVSNIDDAIIRAKCMLVIPIGNSA